MKFIIFSILYVLIISPAEDPDPNKKKEEECILIKKKKNCQVMIMQVKSKIAKKKVKFHSKGIL